jgi:hypothetical protein
MSEAQESYTLFFKKEAERFYGQANTSIKLLLILSVVFLVLVVMSVMSEMELFPILVLGGVAVMINYVHYHLTMVQANHYSALVKLIEVDERICEQRTV